MNQFIEDVRFHFQQLFWDDVPRRRVLVDLAQMKRQARQAVTALARQEAIKKELSKRLVEHENRSAFLAARIQIYLHVGDHPNAWRYALELDRLSKITEQERSALHRAQRLYQVERAHLCHLTEQLADL
ncbi:MAG TPA: hypothetical protein VGY66_33305 [Gemmataceae bacterium]|jgi:hypothetical protein|nr:hypothetical protein [Gemmataceae bacterium]